MNAIMWFGGVLVFGALNFTYSAQLGVTVAVTTVLGGITTCAVAYLLSERILRASDRARAVLRRPGSPGAAGRAHPGRSWAGRWAAGCRCSAWASWRWPRWPATR